jgi:hypothetical protein
MRLFQLLPQFKFLRTPTNSDGPSKGGPLILDIPMEGIRYMKLKAIAVMALMTFGLCMPVKAQVASTVPASIAGSISMPAGMVHDITPFGQIDGKQNPLTKIIRPARFLFGRPRLNWVEGSHI